MSLLVSVTFGKLADHTGRFGAPHRCAPFLIKSIQVVGCKNIYGSFVVFVVVLVLIASIQRYFFIARS